MRRSGYLIWGFIVILLIWLMGHWWIDSRFIPNPFEILAHTVILLLQFDFWQHIVVSGLRLFASIGLALVIGVAVGVTVARNNMLDSILSPVLYIMFPVPKAAFLPVIFVLFGLSDISKIILIFLILFFQMAMATYDAVKSIPKSLYTAAKSLGLRKGHMYRHLIVPAILPNLFSALRISIGIGVAVLFFVETYATNYGLGYYIMNHWSLLDYKNMYSGILVLSFMGYSTFRVIDVLERQIVRWT